jgi:hypothetical protein
MRKERAGQLGTLRKSETGSGQRRSRCWRAKTEHRAIRSPAAMGGKPQRNFYASLRRFMLQEQARFQILALLPVE